MGPIILSGLKFSKKPGFHHLNWCSLPYKGNFPRNLSMFVLHPQLPATPTLPIGEASICPEKELWVNRSLSGVRSVCRLLYCFYFALGAPSLQGPTLTESGARICLPLQVSCFNLKLKYPLGSCGLLKAWFLLRGNGAFLKQKPMRRL